MTTERDEDRAIQEALEALDQFNAAGLPSRDLDGEATEYLELLGLLPYTLEQQPVRPSLKAEILGRIGGEEAEAAGFQAEALAKESAGPNLETFARFQAPEPVAPRQGRILNWALAAMLGLCALGLTFLAGQVHEQSAQLADLRAHGAEHGAGTVASMHDNFELIRTIAPQVYPLQPSINQATPVNARGMIYVCPNHQRWYLSLKGLPPSPKGETYHFWFMTEDGAVSGGPLDVGSDAAVVLEKSSMPKGTEGFTVTLEQEGSLAGVDKARVVLEASEAISL